MLKAHFAKRLLRVAQALRESPKPKKFTMGGYNHACGSPACALGHYASRDDLQRLFRWSAADAGYVFRGKGDDRIDYGDLRVLEHFGITDEEAYKLFNSGGCGGAITPKRAAAYIEKFVADRRGGV